MLEQNHKKNGFTLIEMILTIIVIGIISSVSAKILMNGLDTYAFVTNRKDAVQHARVGMSRMVSEMLLLKSSDIATIQNQNFGFWDSGGNLTSFKQGTQNGKPVLYRGSDFLAGPLSLLDFDYLKADGSSALWSLDVRRINIELSIDTLGEFGTVTLRTEVFPRNFMYTNFQ